MARAVILAPTINVGHGDVISFLAPLVNVGLQSYLGPVPLAFMTDALQGLGQVACNFKATQTTVCEGVEDLLFGPSGGQQPLVSIQPFLVVYGWARTNLCM